MMSPTSTWCSWSSSFCPGPKSSIEVSKLPHIFTQNLLGTAEGATQGMSPWRSGNLGNFAHYIFICPASVVSVKPSDGGMIRWWGFGIDDSANLGWDSVDLCGKNPVDQQHPTSALKQQDRINEIPFPWVSLMHSGSPSWDAIWSFGRR